MLRGSPRSPPPTPARRPTSSPRPRATPIAPWDRAFHAERVRRERFDVDAAALRPYLELERVLHDGVFHAAGLLYGLRFAERHDLPTYHPDVRVFDVSDDDGPLGLFVADLYARDTKRGGAWMNAFVDAVPPARHAAGRAQHAQHPAARRRRADPAHLRVVRTLFHEFGHALHGLFSDVRYPKFAGTAVPRDFVEYPSQVNEMWLEDPEILAAYARHHETGEPLPPELLDELDGGPPLRRRRRDHGVPRRRAAGPGVAPAGAGRGGHRRRGVRSRRARTAVDVPSVPPRYRSTYFNHVFGGAYSAGYYSYIWSEVLDADTVEWFTEHGGLRRENGERFRRELLALRRRRRSRWRPTRRSAAAARTSPRCWFVAVCWAVTGGISLTPARCSPPGTAAAPPGTAARASSSSPTPPAPRSPAAAAATRRVPATSPRPPAPASPTPAARRPR